tara:strand:- start:2400 stop:2636 length:237 start_codon:yes stop_codon:yes gene_type:complete
MIKNQRNKEGKKDGYFEEYYSNGQLSSKGNYLNGKRHGYWEYYNHGQLWDKGMYKNGKKHNLWESYWSNGELTKQFHL